MRTYPLAEGRSEVLVPYAIRRPLAIDFVETLFTKYGGIDA